MELRQIVERLFAARHVRAAGDAWLIDGATPGAPYRVAADDRGGDHAVELAISVALDAFAGVRFEAAPGAPRFWRQDHRIGDDPFDDRFVITGDRDLVLLWVDEPVRAALARAYSATSPVPCRLALGDGAATVRVAVREDDVTGAAAAVAVLDAVVAAAEHAAPRARSLAALDAPVVERELPPALTRLQGGRHCQIEKGSWPRSVSGVVAGTEPPYRFHASRRIVGAEHDLRLEVSVAMAELSGGELDVAVRGERSNAEHATGDRAFDDRYRVTGTAPFVTIWLGAPVRTAFYATWSPLSPDACRLGIADGTAWIIGRLPSNAGGTVASMIAALDALVAVVRRWSDRWRALARALGVALPPPGWPFTADALRLERPRGEVWVGWRIDDDRAYTELRARFRGGDVAAVERARRRLGVAVDIADGDVRIRLDGVVEAAARLVELGDAAATLGVPGSLESGPYR